MKNNQMCAIIVDELNDDALKPLTNERPLGTLFFDCKYRLIDFELSSVVNAGIHNVQLIEDEDKVRSVFDHLGGGREWGLDAIGSYQYVNYFQDSENKKAAGEKYFNNTIEFLEKSHTAYTVIMGTRMLCNLN
ncbi:glucose-1-phosphate adenylyltransferase subunit GlgD, partial [Roseburia faecis]|nr:glucose-1-phosphate adenylyltransferase subunit GlgD [Roseburia faecis]